MLEYYGDNLNMYQFSNRLKLTSVVIIALFLAAAPGLQAFHLSRMSYDCSRSCCSGICCDQSKAPADALSLKSSCCCRVSAPEAEAEVPYEAQLRPITNPDTYAEVTSATSLETVVEIVFSPTDRTSQPSAHGPPLYLLNASLLI